MVLGHQVILIVGRVHLVREAEIQVLRLVQAAEAAGMVAVQEVVVEVVPVISTV